MALWNPGFLGLVGAKPPLNTGLPSIASPVWGLDTSDPTLFRSAASGTTQPASGGTVQRVLDLFGGARVMQQATEANKPTWQANALNGKASLRFGGAGAAVSYMLMDGTNPGALFQSRSFTGLVVYRRDAAGTYGGLFCAGNAALGQNSGSYDLWNIESGPGGWANLYRNGGSDYASCLPVNPQFTAGQTQKVVFRSAPANGMEIRVKNQRGIFGGTGALPASVDSFVWDTAALGTTMGYQAERIPLATLVGDMFEVRWWASRASDADFAALGNYADLKWGV